jgi:hypothetical protein
MLGYDLTLEIHRATIRRRGAAVTAQPREVLGFGHARPTQFVYSAARNCPAALPRIER